MRINYEWGRLKQLREVCDFIPGVQMVVYAGL